MSNRQFYSDYQEVLHDFRVQFSRGGIWTGIILVISGVGLDYSLYPEKQTIFFIARLITAGLIGSVFCLLLTEYGKRFVRGLTFTWLLFPQMMIAWMISQTEGASSPYYGGMTLAIYASGIVFSLGLWHNIIFGLSSYFLYVLAVYRFSGEIPLRGVFAVHSIFLIFSTIVSAVFTYFNEKARMLLFTLKVELSAINQELNKKNITLTEIKGQMLQQEKMAALGTLAAGLLHEINNPVNFSSMALSLALEDEQVRSIPIAKESLTDALEGLKRIQRIVGDLKTFAYRPQNVDIHNQYFYCDNAAQSALRLMGHELKGIQVECNMPKNVLVYGDETAIIGVLINLISNAILAIRKVSREMPLLRITGHYQTDKFEISIWDNGSGIAPANLSRIFEPFFTTREVGQGLGLGLSMSYSVIKQHGGTLQAESLEGEWTRIYFNLRLVEETPSNLSDVN